jgi:hypothetical protein
MDAQHGGSQPESEPSRLRGDLETTTRAVAEAHLAHLDEAIEPDGWERRGLLGRLARLSRADVRR